MRFVCSNHSSHIVRIGMLISLFNSEWNKIKSLKCFELKEFYPYKIRKYERHFYMSNGGTKNELKLNS